MYDYVCVYVTVCMDVCMYVCMTMYCMYNYICMLLYACMYACMYHVCMHGCMQMTYCFFGRGNIWDVSPRLILGDCRIINHQMNKDCYGILSFVSNWLL